MIRTLAGSLLRHKALHLTLDTRLGFGLSELRGKGGAQQANLRQNVAYVNALVRMLWNAGRMSSQGETVRDGENKN